MRGRLRAAPLPVDRSSPCVLSIAHPPAITTPPLARVRIGFVDSLNMMLHGSRVGTWISALTLCHSVLGSSILVRLDRLRPIGYTFGMKTAISLPERVFREAERFARRARKTRSKLYAEALAEYLARHAPDGITEAMNQVSDRLGASENTFQTKAARRILSKESW